MKFQRPEFLVLLPIFIALVYFLLKRRKSSLGLGNIRFYVDSTPTYLRYLLKLPEFLLVTSLFLAIFSASEVSIASRYREVYLPGIDIMMVLDVSRSMAAEDLSPRNRFDVARAVIKDFVNKRVSDRIGLVAFAGAPLLICPLTLDHQFLLDSLTNLSIGEIEDGTAIGLALVEAVTDLQSSRSSKVIILLTDGVNNRGEISPLDAAMMAKEAKIRVYTIGVGKRGMARIPIESGVGIRYIERKVSIDEDTLSKIATLTNGKYFRAEDPIALRTIFKEIDSLEKRRTRVKISSTYKPIYWEINIVILLLLLTWLLVKIFIPEVP